MNRKFPVDDPVEEDQEGEDVVVKKKEKKRKSKEEKGRDRRIVFWVMIFIILVTAGFWLKAYFEGKINTSVDSVQETKKDIETPGNKDSSEKGFFVRYKI